MENTSKHKETQDISAGNLREFAGICGNTNKRYINIRILTTIQKQDYKTIHIKILGNHEAKKRGGLRSGCL